MKYFKRLNLLVFFIVSIVFFIVSCNNFAKNNLVENKKIQVAVFTGNGASATCILETIEALKIDVKINAIQIQAHQIQNGDLDSFDVLIFPGGSGSKELNNLGEIAAEKVQEFVEKNGKGIIGICAGGYLMSTTKGYPSLKLSSASVTDRAHYNRGRGLIEVELTENGIAIFPELMGQPFYLQYYDGPILIPSGENMMYNELAIYKTDIHPDEFAPKGITPGKTFMLEEKYGKGKIMIIAGHPESTPGMRWIIPRMVRQVSGHELISYNRKWVSPELNDSAILFNAELRKFEKKCFWKLFDKNKEVKIQAMCDLNTIRSRPAVRYNIGLLRDNSPEVRKHAAYLLKQTEYTTALNDLKQALVHEKDSSVFVEIKKTIAFMTNF